MADEHFNTPEVWKAIPDFPGYEVSDYGRVRSYWRNMGPPGRVSIEPNPQRILKAQKLNAYLMVTIRQNKKRIARRIHILVLLAFVGPCPTGMTTRHRDGKGTNNHLSNLLYDTHQNNIMDKAKHGTLLKGEDIHWHKLTEKQIMEIRTLATHGYSCREIGVMFGVTHSNIYYIVTRKTWKHI